MKKLALSLVALMVAGAGVSVSSVGCSSSSSTGTSEDSGTGSDVTMSGDDSGSDTGTPVGDSGTPDDTGTPVADSGGGICATDAAAAGSITVQGSDGGENTACEACIAANCSSEQCACLTDPNVDDAGTPQCGNYGICVYTTFLTLQATNDAGATTNLPAAEMTCASSTGAPSSSQTLGALLISCIAQPCLTQCVTSQ